MHRTGPATSHAVAAVVTTVLLLAACTGGPEKGAAPVLASEAAADITAAVGGTVRLGDASIVIPPGALTADARVIVRRGSDARPAPDAAPLALVLGEPYLFGIEGGATLQAAATVTVPYDPAEIPPESETFAPFVSDYDDGARSWVPGSSNAEPARRTVSEQTRRVSWSQAWTWLVPAAREALARVVAELFGTTGGPAPEPVCERDPPAGVELQAPAGDGVRACLGAGGANDVAELAIANNRPFAVVVNRPAGVKVEHIGRDGIYGGLDAVLAEAFPSDAYVPGGATAEFTLSLPAAPAAYELTAAPRTATVALDLLTSGIGLFAPGARSLTSRSASCVVDAVGTADDLDGIADVAKTVVDCVESVDRSNPVAIALARLRDPLATATRSTDLFEGGGAAGRSRLGATWTPAERLTAASRLRLDGIGPVKVGMSLEEASRVSGLRFAVDPDSGPDPARCGFATPEGAPPGLRFMVADRTTIVRIDVTGPSIATDTGLRVASTEAEVTAAYPDRIAVRPHPFRVPDGRYLVHVPDEPAVKGFELLFETDGRTVTMFRVGVIEFVEAPEGCA